VKENETFFEIFRNILFIEIEFSKLNDYLAERPAEHAIQL
jgi:hypothetical protein